ncbi:MAG: C4-type zinc ribbon domain-containing protein [Planctomycetota bacterium]
MTLHDRLEHLNQIDGMLRALTSRVGARTRRLDKLTDKLDVLHQQHDELDAQRQQSKAHATTLEKQAADIDERVTTMRDRMNSVTSNKEYSAMLVEMNTLKADKTQIDDETLEAMTTVEQLEAKLGEIEAQLGEQKTLVSGAKGELEEAEAEIQQRKDELTGERTEAAAEIDEDTLRQYERLIVEHEGEALARVEEQDRRRKEYTCGECYMALPVETVSAVMRSPDSVVCCPCCGRILTMAKDLKSAIAAK